MDVIYPKEREEINRREEAIKAVVEALECMREIVELGGFGKAYAVAITEQALQRWEECK